MKSFEDESFSPAELQEQNRVFGFLRDNMSFLQARIYDFARQGVDRGDLAISVPSRFLAASAPGDSPPSTFLGIPVYRRESDTLEDRWEVRIFTEHTGFYWSSSRGIHG